MTGDWRRLALAALAASGRGLRLRHARPSPGTCPGPRQGGRAEGARQGSRSRERRRRRGRRQETCEEEATGSRRGAGAIDAAAEGARGRQVGAGRAGADHRAQRRRSAAGHHGQGAALSRHRLPAAEETGASHRRPHERAVAEGRPQRIRSQRRAEAAVVRLSGSGTGRKRWADRSGGAERCASDADGLCVRGRYAPGCRAGRRSRAADGSTHSPAGSADRPPRLPARKPAAGDYRVDPARTGGFADRRSNPAHGAATPRCAAAPSQPPSASLPPSPQAGSAFRSGWCARRPRRRRSRCG